jgi:tape measure domain-containing protein
MAKLGDLVVRIGADTRDLNKSLGRVQRNMRSMTGNITRMGQDMTRSITLPLLGIGAAAVKSAADLETLETQFVSLTGGAAQASKMVAQLNEFTAATPFQLEEVGNAARQLIASGTAISEVNDQLQFLGDIAATSGKSIEEIAAIFAKVNAKGKVELESLNQLAERGIPIFAELAEATGLPADKLGAGAVSVEQFNDVLKSFSKEGGFAAGAMERLSRTTAGRFSTAMDEAKRSAAELGKVILPVINNILDRIVDLSKKFLQMDDGVKRAVVTLGALAAAFGPVLAFLPQIIDQVKLLSVVMASNPIIAFAGVITAIGLALKAMKIDADEARTSIEDLRDSFSELTEESREQKRQDAVETIKQLLAYEKLRKKFEEVTDQAKELGLKEATFPFINFVNPRLREMADNFTDAEKAAFDFGTKFFGINQRMQPTIASTEAVTDAVIELQETMAALTVPDVVDDIVPDATKLQSSATAMKKLTTATIAQSNANKELQQSTWNVGDLIEKAKDQTTAFGQSLTQAFASAAASAQTFADFLRQITVDIVSQFLRQAASKALAAGNIPLAVALATGSGLVQRVLTPEVPALAQGGLAYGPTTALVGDNRSARIDPEVIAPLSKLKDMMGGNVVEVVGRIKGDDIFLSNARNTINRNRYS